MADECADVTNEEQLVICLCWVDENLEAHEDFVGLQDWVTQKQIQWWKLFLIPSRQWDWK